MIWKEVKFKCPKCGKIFTNTITEEEFKRIGDRLEPWLAYCTFCCNQVRTFPIPKHLEPKLLAGSHSRIV